MARPVPPKSGNANEDGIYERQHAWFTCFAPYDDPEIALTVLVEDGGEGSLYAVPLADRILRAYFETTGDRDRGKILKKETATASPISRTSSRGRA